MGPSKKRTHSLFRQGAMLYELIPMMPEPRLRPLVQRFGARAFDEKAESIVDSHEGTNQIQHSHWYKVASHEWESLIPTICANVSLLRSKPAIPVWKLPSCTTWL